MRSLFLDDNDDNDVAKKRSPTARLRLEAFSQNRVRQLSRIYLTPASARSRPSRRFFFTMAQQRAAVSRVHNQHPRERERTPS